MKKTPNNHNTEESKSHSDKKRKLSQNLGRYYRILAEDFLIAIGIIIFYSLFSGFIHLLSMIPFLHAIKNELVYFEKAHFWVSFVVFLIFPPFSILKIIVAKLKELKNHDNH